ncbi:hypothetical protein [Sulfurimonas sp.]
MEKLINENAKKEMQKALLSYKKDKNSVKEFYPCSQELSIWLQAKVK